MCLSHNVIISSSLDDDDDDNINIDVRFRDSVESFDVSISITVRSLMYLACSRFNHVYGRMFSCDSLIHPNLRLFQLTPSNLSGLELRISKCDINGVIFPRCIFTLEDVFETFTDYSEEELDATIIYDNEILTEREDMISYAFIMQLQYLQDHDYDIPKYVSCLLDAMRETDFSDVTSAICACLEENEECRMLVCDYIKYNIGCKPPNDVVRRRFVSKSIPADKTFIITSVTFNAICHTMPLTKSESTDLVDCIFESDMDDNDKRTVIDCLLVLRMIKRSSVRNNLLYMAP